MSHYLIVYDHDHDGRLIITLVGFHMCVFDVKALVNLFNSRLLSPHFCDCK